MLDIITRAGCFVLIVVLGYVLRRIGWFREEDFDVISTIVLKITLPAAIIISFNGKDIDLSMLFLVVLGLLCGIVYMGVGYLINLKKSPGKRAFDVLNLPGYNIGNFTLPFVQSFLGPMGVVVTSLFDTGNAVVCLGGAYGIASLVRDGAGFSVKRVLTKLLHSVPFMSYVVMVILCLLKLELPGPVASFAEIIGQASPFMAMFMIGVGFKLELDREHVGYIVKYIIVRYSLAVVFALSFYFLLPFSLEIRQTLVILVFAPFCTSAPAFTSELKEDVGLASAVNSVSIIISVIIIIALLSMML